MDNNVPAQPFQLIFKYNKDTEIINYLKNNLFKIFNENNIIINILNNNDTIIEIILAISYYYLSIFSIGRTMGEEYSYTMMYNNSDLLFISNKRLILLFIFKIIAIIINKYQNTSILLKELTDIGLILFYLSNEYYEIPYRILRISHIATKKLPMNINYKRIGYLLLIIKIISLIKFIKSKYINKDSTNINNTKRSNNNIIKNTIKCSICFSKIKTITATKCGHLFCFKCIYKYLQIKPECPECRNEVKINQINVLNVVL